VSAPTATDPMWRRCASCHNYDHKRAYCTFKALDMKPEEGKWCAVHESHSEWLAEQDLWIDA
jgi:hypothetical protein